MDTHTPEVVLAPPLPSPPEAPASTDLFCLNCDYNLTGLEQDRCPECGKAFDRGALIEWATRPNQPLPFGRATDGKHHSIFLASLFAPRRLGRQLPPHGSLLRVVGLTLGWRIILGLACVAASAPIVRRQLMMLGDTANFTLIMANLMRSAAGMLTIIVGFALAEVAVAASLTLLVEPRAVPKSRGRFRFWYSLSLCFSGFSYLTLVIVWSLPQIFLLFRPYRAPSIGTLTGLFLLAVVLLISWWRCLGLAVAARAAGSSRTLLAIGLIPVVGILLCAATFVAASIVEAML